MSYYGLSSHDHGNCELCDLLEKELAALKAKLKAMEHLIEEWKDIEEDWKNDAAGG